MKFELLSKNTRVLIDEVVKNDRLVKLIDSKTLDGKLVNGGSLVMNKILPNPFTKEVPQNQETNLRIFFAMGDLNRRVVLDTKIVFQVVLHKDLWAMTDEEGTNIVRPYEIMDEIVKTFEDKTVGTLGVIHFKRFFYQALDKDYGLYNLEATMTTI